MIASQRFRQSEGCLVVITDVSFPGNFHHRLWIETWECRELRDLGFRTSALGDVPHASGEERALAEIDAGDSQFNGKDGAITTRGLSFNPSAHQAASAFLQVTEKIFTAAVCQQWQHDKIRELSSHDFRAAVAKGLLRGRIELHDVTILIHGNHAIERGLNHCARPRLAQLQRLRCALLLGDVTSAGIDQLLIHQRHGIPLQPDVTPIASAKAALKQRRLTLDC